MIWVSFMLQQWMGEYLKLMTKSSSETSWQIDIQQEIEASPILDGSGNVIIVSTDNLNKISPEGNDLWVDKY